MRARTVRLDAGIDPIALGARSGLLWSRDRFALAGVGECARIPLERPAPAGARAAQAALAALVGDDDLGVPGSGPVAFTALPFAPDAPGELVVPAVAVGRDGDGLRWLTVLDGTLTDDDAMDLVGTTLARPVPAAAEPTDYRLHSVLAPEVWRDDIVAEAVRRIRAGVLRKVVLARELHLETDAPIDPAVVIERLKATFPPAIVFCVGGFLGASPELLVARHGDVVRAHPLAGTVPRSADPAVDQRNAAQLLASTKNRHEHAITIDWLIDRLLPQCSYIDAEPEPSIVTLANVHHLGTVVEGRLSSPPPSVLELVAATHPTPALGGDPQGVALQLIAELERAERGRYGGPTGWVDAAGNGAFAVAIRSAQVDPTDPCRLRLFAGTGIVADSDPQSELSETRAKFAAMLGALLRP